MEPNITPDPNSVADAPVSQDAATAVPDTQPESTPEIGRTLEAPQETVEATQTGAQPPIPSAQPAVPEVPLLPEPLQSPAMISAESQIAEVEAAPQVVEPEAAEPDAAPQSIATLQSADAPVENTSVTNEEVAPIAESQVPPSPAPPRSLVPGAFLRGEYEVKTVLSRGLTNIYVAQSGDYGDVTPKLIAEREATQSEVSTVSTPVSGRTFASALFVQGEGFSQDDRDYRVFDFFESSSLQDFRAPTNDERLLSMLHALAHGLAELEAQNFHADLTTETLRVDGNGELKFPGFVSSSKEGDNALDEMRAMTDYLLKHVFAESSTMRLDDRFAGLALSEEVKNLARRIDKDSPEAFASLADVAAAIDALFQPQHNIVVDAALLSDVGQERELNEDAGMIIRTQRSAHLGSHSFDLYVVSDGMGGHEGGEVASDLTLTSLQKNLDALQIDWNDNVAIRAALVDVIDAVNAEVVALTETPKYRGTRAKPGATLVFAIRLGARVFVCNVGDSRAFKFNGKLSRVSKDHSYVQNLVDRGEITDDEAWDHPEGSIITAHIGYPKLKTRDVFLRLFAPGDTLLLVSDGITDMLRDREVEAYLQSAQDENATTICRDLVDAANAAGGLDNITTLCVRFK